jgi:transcriptional regulator with XRE-family HTH domain
MSQEAVALAAGLQRKTLWELETGKRKAGACYSTLHRVCGALGVTLAELATVAQLLHEDDPARMKRGGLGTTTSACARGTHFGARDRL